MIKVRVFFILVIILLRNEGEAYLVGRDSRRLVGVVFFLRWVVWWRFRIVYRFERWIGSFGSTCIGEGLRRRRLGFYRGKGSFRGLWKIKEYLFGDWFWVVRVVFIRVDF